MKIFVRNNDIPKALRVLKKKLFEEGDSKQLRSKKHFVSKGEQRRLDEKAGRKRWLKKQVVIEKNRLRKEREMLKNRKPKTNVHRPNKGPYNSRPSAKP